MSAVDETQKDAWPPKKDAWHTPCRMEVVVITFEGSESCSNLGSGICGYLPHKWLKISFAETLVNQNL